MTDVSQLSNAQLLAALGQSSTPTSQSSAPPGASGSQPSVSGPTLLPLPPGLVPSPNPLDRATGGGVPLTSLTDDQIKAYLGAPAAPLADAAQSAAPGLAKGIAGLAGLPGDLENLWGNGVDYLAPKAIGALQDLVGYRGGKYVNGQWQPSKDFPYLGSNPETADLLAWQDRTKFQPFDYAHDGLGPATSGDINNAIQSVTGPYHQPQTPAGRFVDTVGQFAPAAVFPGSLGAKALRVLVPSTTSDLAGEATRGTPMEPWARAGGALLGGGLQSAGERIAAAPLSVMGNAAKGLTEDQIAQATALRSQAAEKGIQLTIPEAVQQVTNGATNLSRTQRLVESSTLGSEAMRPYFAQRPDQVRGAVMNFADQIAPPGSPGMLGQDAQRAAQGAQMDANAQRSALSGPAYNAADQESVPAQPMVDLLSRIKADMSGDQTGLLSPRLGQLAQSLTNGGEPITNIGNLSTARNYWRDQIDLPPTGNDPLTKHQAGMISGHLDDLDALLKANPNRAAGDQVYAAASRNIVDPLNAGPVGQIGGTADLGSQTSALYPQNPPLGQPAETAAAIDALNSQREGLAAALTRQHVGSTFNQSTRNLTSGPNQYGGALFARNIAGNAEQGATLNAGLNQVDPTGALGSHWSDLVDALQATGRRERPGSMTAFNAEDQNALHAAPLAVRSLGNLLDPLEYGRLINSGVGKMAYGRNIAALSDLMTTPDTTDALTRALASVRANSFVPRAVLALPSSQQGGP